MATPQDHTSNPQFDERRFELKEKPTVVTDHRLLSLQDALNECRDKCRAYDEIVACVEINTERGTLPECMKGQTPFRAFLHMQRHWTELQQQAIDRGYAEIVDGVFTWKDNK